MRLLRKYTTFKSIRYTHILKECINCEIKIENILCNFIVLHRSPSPSQDIFESFIDNLELTIDAIAAKNPYLIDILGEFKAKLSTSCRSDKSTYESSRTDGLLSSYGLQQLINEPTHRTGRSSSFIDLLFCSRRNLVMESDVHPSLHPNCHHQIFYAKFKLKVYYPPPYERKVWHYQNADFDAIKKTITDVSLERAFENFSVDEKVSFFNKTIKNTLSNYISQEVITIDDRYPPWFNKNIKYLIFEKNKAWRLYIRSNKNDFLFFEKFTSLQIQLSDLIETRKQNYHFRLTEKLRDRNTSPKAYWSLLKTFLNNKKIPCFPPTFYENDFVIDFQKKVETFNEFFAKQCAVVPNSSKCLLNGKK